MINTLFLSTVTGELVNSFICCVGLVLNFEYLSYVGLSVVVSVVTLSVVRRLDYSNMAE